MLVRAAAAAITVLACSRYASCLVSQDLEQQLLAEARQADVFEWTRGIRRSLHRIPELGFQETRTSETIRRHLDQLGIAYRYPVATTGVTADLGSGQPVVALRSDIDALPIEEAVASDYVSQHPGRMHACGHDTHMAMLLTAARLLKGREASLRGTVRLIFQPAEEGPGGAVDVIAAGALEGVSAVSGLHVWPTTPSGTVTTRAGTIMAAQDSFQVVVSGRGGHGAMPHLTSDPVVAAAMVVVALQPLVSRETSPTDGAVVTVANFNTGNGAANVIPDSATLTGTIRALLPERFAELQFRVESVVKATAEAHRCSAAIQWEKRPYPPTRNNAKLAAVVGGVAGRLATFEDLAEPSMGAEDFSFLAERVPGVFTLLGIRNETAGSVHGLHTPRFQMDESQMPLGAALHAATAFALLETHAQGSASSSGGAGGEL